MYSSKPFCLFSICASLICAAVSADVLDDIKPGEWYEAPNSNLVTVKPLPTPYGQNGIGAVMDSWSGGAFDTKRNRLIVWGGGHGDYSGNEIYVFDIATLKWLRASDPSTDVGGTEATGIYPDGNPRSRHTYDYIQYVPSLDRFCTFGGSAMYPTAGTSTNKTHCFDFDAKKWTYTTDAAAWGFGTMAGRDPETGLIWLAGGGNNAAFVQWDPAKNAWQTFSHYNKGWFEYYHTGAIGKGKFVAVGMGKTIQWDLKNPTAQSVEVATVGPTTVPAGQSPGFAFNEKGGYFVGWNGGKDVFAYSTNGAWIKVDLSANNKVTPTAAVPNGTYGRFQYIPSKDLFMVVNRVNENVFFFRMPANVVFPVGIKEIRGEHPLNGKVEIHILDGASLAGFRGTIRLGGLESGSEKLTCRIFSARNELIYEQPLAVGQNTPISLQNGAPGLLRRDLAPGAYFMEVGGRDRVLAYRRLAFLQ